MDVNLPFSSVIPSTTGRAISLRLLIDINWAPGKFFACFFSYFSTVMLGISRFDNKDLYHYRPVWYPDVRLSAHKALVQNFCYGIWHQDRVSKFAAFHTNCYFIYLYHGGTDQSSIGFLDFKLGSWYWITCLSVDLSMVSTGFSDFS